MKDSEIVELYFKRSETAVLETDKKYSAYLCQVAYNILRDLCDIDSPVEISYADFHWLAPTVSLAIPI